jgi:hypothetical protein
MSAPNTVPRDDLPAILDQLRRGAFYGSLELKFEGGEVVLLKKTETIKPNCRDNRGRDAHHPECT